MSYRKWHMYSSIVMFISMLVCIYSGHKMVKKKQKGYEVYAINFSQGNCGVQQGKQGGEKARDERSRSTKE